MIDDPKSRDPWDKVDILLKGLLPVAVAAVGYFGTSYLSNQQRSESTRQFYTSLQAQRETADANLRKEMFKYVIENFLGSVDTDPRKRVVGLEMLALNFHDSFDLMPLFDDTYRAVQAQSASDEERQRLLARLADLSREIVDHQITALADIHHQWDRVIDLTAAQGHGGLGSLAPIRLAPLLREGSGTPPGTAVPTALDLLLEVREVDVVQQRVKLRLQVADPLKSVLVERSFWVTGFDFPALHNIRLPNRDRIAVVLKRFEADHVSLAVVHFPEARASLKEKPYIDDLINDVGRLDERRAAGAAAGQ